MRDVLVDRCCFPCDALPADSSFSSGLEEARLVAGLSGCLDLVLTGLLLCDERDDGSRGGGVFELERA